MWETNQGQKECNLSEIKMCNFQIQKKKHVKEVKGHYKLLVHPINIMDVIFPDCILCKG